MTNAKAYYKFWVAVIIASAIISMMGCSNYKINQSIESYGGTLYLITEVRDSYKMMDFCETYKMWMDKTITDSVKCLRYNQAKELIEKIEHVENFKCE